MENKVLELKAKVFDVLREQSALQQRVQQLEEPKAAYLKELAELEGKGNEDSPEPVMEPRVTPVAGAPNM